MPRPYDYPIQILNTITDLPTLGKEMPSMKAAQSDTLPADTLASDFAAVMRTMEDFFARISSGDWGRLTDPKPGGWTLHQTLAHVTIVAELYHQGIVDSLNRRPLSYPDAPDRESLTRFNYRQIALREAESPRALVERFLTVLGQSAEAARQATPDELNLPAQISWWTRQATLAELIGAQMAHPCITHGAQLAHGAATQPLWTGFPPDLLHRQITRFFRGQMSPAYNVSRGGSLRVTVCFLVGGAAGGRWYLRVSPDGALAGEGWGGRFPSLLVWVRSVHALLDLFTLQTGIWRAMFTGRMLGVGNIPLGFRLVDLILPPEYQG